MNSLNYDYDAIAIGFKEFTTGSGTVPILKTFDRGPYITAHIPISTGQKFVVESGDVYGYNEIAGHFCIYDADVSNFQSI